MENIETTKLRKITYITAGIIVGGFGILLRIVGCLGGCSESISRNIDYVASLVFIGAMSMLAFKKSLAWGIVAVVSVIVYLYAGFTGFGDV